MSKLRMNFDLDRRTFDFARAVREFVKTLPKTGSNIEDSKQLVRSSGSVGANYLEANEALSKRDFFMRMKISRKEAKETSYWLRLLDGSENPTVETRRNQLLAETTELLKIFSAIISRSGSLSH